jgi:glutaminyl-tRNA synthetase
MEDPPKKFFRLAPGREVRLKYAYIIRCDEVIRDNTGEITELRCSYDPETKSGEDKSGKKVKGTLHWVSAKDCVPADIHLYDHLFLEASEEEEISEGTLNPESRITMTNAMLESSVANAQPGENSSF